MSKNFKMKKSVSKKVFTKSAIKTKTLNSAPPIMRGGIRL